MLEFNSVLLNTTRHVVLRVHLYLLHLLPPGNDINYELYGFVLTNWIHSLEPKNFPVSHFCTIYVLFAYYLNTDYKSNANASLLLYDDLLLAIIVTIQ